MAYTETSEVGWFDRIKESIKGLVIGVLFVAIAPCLLICNEKRSVDTAEGIGEMSSSLAKVDAAKPDAAAEGKPILVTGTAETAETLKDDKVREAADAGAHYRLVVEIEKSDDGNIRASVEPVALEVGDPLYTLRGNQGGVSSFKP